MRSINESEPDFGDLSELQISFLKPLLRKNVSERPSAEEAYRTSLEILSVLDGGDSVIDLTNWKSPKTFTKSSKFKKNASIISAFLVFGLGLSSYTLISSNQYPKKDPNQNFQSPSLPSSAALDGNSKGDNSPTSKETQANLDLTKSILKRMT